MNKFPICPIFIPANKLNYVEKAIKSGADGEFIHLKFHKIYIILTLKIKM